MTQLAQDIANGVKSILANHAPKLAPYQPEANAGIDAGIALGEKILTLHGLPAITKAFPVAGDILKALGGA